ncbi:MAG TPA: O-methyltransferase [Candidatus Eremiobacteraceae bacterium]|nr:O-methyltransferase [Candidatus Eremiobacteraceae bacterium]
MIDSVREAGHDLNNQLSAILTIADLERKRAPAASQAAKAFETICEAVRRAASSVDALSGPSRDVRYLRDLMPTRDALLGELEALCKRDGIPAVDPATGRFLGAMVSAMLAGSILELGTAYGYSALCMAYAQPETGRIWTIEPDRKRVSIARGFFERAGMASRIEIIEQPALEVLPKLAHRQFDIVFIDALKEEYADYLRLALPHVKRSGLVIVDNLLWSHRAAAPPSDADEASTKSIRRFNELFVNHPQLRATILPVGDGIGVGARIA